jgi:hypothetical protein
MLGKLDGPDVEASVDLEAGRHMARFSHLQHPLLLYGSLSKLPCITRKTLKWSFLSFEGLQCPRKERLSKEVDLPNGDFITSSINCAGPARCHCYVQETESAAVAHLRTLLVYHTLCLRIIRHLIRIESQQGMHGKDSWKAEVLSGERPRLTSGTKPQRQKTGRKPQIFSRLLPNVWLFSCAMALWRNRRNAV